MLRSEPLLDGKGRLRPRDPGTQADTPRALHGKPARALSTSPDEEVRLEEPLAVWLHLSWGIELG